MNIEKLKAEIELKRAALREEQGRLDALRREIDAFARQYERAVGSLERRLDSLQEQLSQLRGSSTASSGGIWGQYASFEESFDAKYRRNMRDTHGPNATIRSTGSRPFNEESLRTLYRSLVRRYHPDTTQKVAQPAPDVSRLDRVTTLADLLEIARRLDTELTDVQIEYRQLMTSPLMQIKIEQSIAKARGGNILREIASRVQIEIDQCEAQLRQLRR
jgi:hypothetical protein